MKNPLGIRLAESVVDEKLDYSKALKKPHGVSPNMDAAAKRGAKALLKKGVRDKSLKKWLSILARGNMQAFRKAASKDKASAERAFFAAMQAGQKLAEDSPLEAPVATFNRHMKLMSPATRELVLRSRMTEIEAFATDRGYNPALVSAVAEVAMRTGRIPELRQYGFSGDDAKAVKHFISGDVLNNYAEDIEGVEEAKASFTYTAKNPITGKEISKTSKRKFTHVTVRNSDSKDSYGNYFWRRGDVASFHTSEKDAKRKAKDFDVTVVPLSANVVENAGIDFDKDGGFYLAEVSPPGFSGTVKAMKDRHGDEIDNPYSLAWSMYQKGAKPKIKPEENPKGIKKYISPEKYAKYKKNK